MAQGLFVEDEDSDIEAFQQELSRQEAKPVPDFDEGDSVALASTADNEDLGDTEDIKDITEGGKTVADEDFQLYPLIPISEEHRQGENKPDLRNIRQVDIQLSLSLPFQYEMVQSCISTDDPFMIMGKGLGMSSIIANVLHVLGTPSNIDGVLKRSLVIVLNATDDDNRQIRDELQELSWLQGGGEVNSDNATAIDIYDDTHERAFNVVNADSLSVEKRRKLYLSGGIVSVTSRILIVDLLSGIIHPNRITGMVILNIETLRSYSNESFIIEIYRSQNKWGFIKGFSEAPETFTMEFSPLRRRMKDLKFKKVLLWPRFRVEISSSLNNSTQNNNVIEVKIEMSNAMSQIQFGLMECLKKCIAELNRKNPQLALDWWNIDNSLDTNFLRSIDSVMIPNWHRISYESKQLVKDIRFLRHLLKLLVVADSVDFYEEVQLSLDANRPSISRKYSESPWLMVDESQLVISNARKRILYNNEYKLEEMPKWEQLINIVDDIAHEKSIRNATDGPILILCSDETTTYQLSKVVKLSNKKEGLRKLMFSKLQMYKEMREERKKMVNEVKNKESDESLQELNVSAAFVKEQINSKRRRTRGAAAVAAVNKLRNSGASAEIETVIQSSEFSTEFEQSDGIVDEDFEDISYRELDHVDHIDDDYQEMDPETDVTSEFGDFIREDKYHELMKESWKERESNFTYIEKNDQIIIEKFNNISDDSLLQEIMPSHIIMFEPDLTFIRRVEIYKATYIGVQPKVFFLYYGESTEEQRHLSTIKREKDAFTKLIRENANLAHHFETLEDLSHFKNLAERKIKLNRLNKRNTRNAGGQEGYSNFTQDVVIVDTREFNASLPGLLFRYGVRVIPCMLSVGDYIISPDICLERKSISDLIGSLENNRLASQCKKMIQYYRYATLLIEFDEGQSFSLEPFSERRNFRKQALSTSHPISSKLSQYDIQSKLAKLVIKFPTLRIIWSSSPLQSVNIILELKLGREQPDPNLVMSFGTNLRKKASEKSSKANSKDNNNTEQFTNLLKIPGVSKLDYFNIRKKIKSFNKLRRMNLHDLIDLTGDNNLSEKIFTYLQREELDELNN